MGGSNRYGLDAHCATATAWNTSVRYYGGHFAWGLAAVATSTTSATTLGGLSFNGLDGIAATNRGLLPDAQKGFAFVVDGSAAKEFALAHWLVGGADGGRLFVRCFDEAITVRENTAGDVLASLTAAPR